MAINIRHTYSSHVEIYFYSEDGYNLHCEDCGDMDNIAERICEILVKHGFSYADVYSSLTGEVLMVVSRT